MLGVNDNNKMIRMTNKWLESALDTFAEFNNLDSSNFDIESEVVRPWYRTWLQNLKCFRLEIFVATLY